MKLLITDIPGTGKTSTGDYLQSEKGFQHLDIEAALKRHDAVGTKIIQDFLNNPADKKVITWGFIPETDDAGVNQLLDLGYQMIWFDGNRDAARREFIKRGDVPLADLDIQMARIEKFNIEKFKPIYFNTFSEDGTFLEKDAIAELIFKKLNKESKSLQLAKSFLGKEVEVVMDRPLGSKHPKHGFIYEINYGFIENTTSGDGKELDAYYLGTNKPLEKVNGKVIAIIHRLNDDDDKLVVVSEGITFTDEEIMKQVNFQERWFRSEIVR